MDRSILGVVAIAIGAVTSTACTAARSEGADARRAINFLVSASSAHPAELRVIGSRVNLQEPMSLEAAGDDVRLTFAERGREGRSMVLDPRSLVVRESAVVQYAEHAPSAGRGGGLPCLPLEAVVVTLPGRGSMKIWNDAASGQIVAQHFDRAGESAGPVLALSPAGMEAFGSPRAATTDGRRVVVAFFAATEERFEVVVTSVDSP